MKKKVFTLNWKKYFSSEEYIKARNQFLNYQSEQEQAIAKFGFASECVVLAGEQSEITSYSASPFR